MCKRVEEMSPKKHLVIQGSVRIAVAIAAAVRIGLAVGDAIHPTCPSVLDSIALSDGFPASTAGLDAVLIALGFGYLTGLLMLAFTRWPKGFLAIRVAVAKNGAPVAWRAGLATMLPGAVLLGVLQLAC